MALVPINFLSDLASSDGVGLVSVLNLFGTFVNGMAFPNYAPNLLDLARIDNFVWESVFFASYFFARSPFYTQKGVDISDSDDCVRGAMKILFLFFDIPHDLLPCGLGLLLDAPVVAFSVCPRGSLLIPCTNFCRLVGFRSRWWLAYRWLYCLCPGAARWFYSCVFALCLFSSNGWVVFYI